MATHGIGQLRRTVNHLGYRVDESSSRPPCGPESWRVDATRAGRIISASACTQADAWELVCQMAQEIEREQPHEAATT